MKDWFFDRIGELAISCGRDLSRQINADQVADWAEEFGKPSDLELTNAAFKILRSARGFAGAWPTYREMRQAFAEARDQRAKAEEARAREERDAAVIQPGRLAAAVLFVSQNQGVLAPQDVELAVAAILSPGVCDEDLERFLRGRRALSMPAGPAREHSDRELKLAAAGATSGDEFSR